MTNGLTIVYYTANRQDPEFEKRICAELVVAANGQQIVSVSQKPMDLGVNIVVGDVGVSMANMLRQMLIGCVTAATDWVGFAESDCLYPAYGHFDYRGPKLDMCYCSDQMWVLKKWKDGFYKKNHDQWAYIAGRDYMIKKLRHRLRFLDQIWKDGVEHGKPSKTNLKYLFFSKHKWEYFKAGNACVHIKRGEGSMYKDTPTIEDIEPAQSLPYWGRADELKGRFLGD